MSNPIYKSKGFFFPKRWLKKGLDSKDDSGFSKWIINQVESFPQVLKILNLSKSLNSIGKWRSVCRRLLKFFFCAHIATLMLIWNIKKMEAKTTYTAPKSYKSLRKVCWKIPQRDFCRVAFGVLLLSFFVTR